jgi:hypothetical protein
LLIPTISTTSLTCNNVCNGVLTGTASGGTPTYTFVWTTSTGTVSGSSLTNQCAGNYTLNVIDSKGCSQTLTTSLSHRCVLLPEG